MGLYSKMILLASGFPIVSYLMPLVMPWLEVHHLKNLHVLQDDNFKQTIRLKV